MAALRMTNTGRPGGQRKAKKVVDFSYLSEISPTPDYFDDEAEAEWERVLSILIDRGEVTTADLPIIENFCICLTDYRKLTRQIMDEGLTLINANGNTTPHPACKLRRDCEMHISAISAMLGFTPKSRATMMKDQGIVHDAGAKDDKPVGF